MQRADLLRCIEDPLLGRDTGLHSELLIVGRGCSIREQDPAALEASGERRHPRNVAPSDLRAAGRAARHGRTTSVCGVESARRIAVIPGDGVGPEVVDFGLRALDAAVAAETGFDYQTVTFPWGSDYYRETGMMMARTLSTSWPRSTRSISERSAPPTSRITSPSGDFAWRSSRGSTKPSACARPSCCPGSAARSPTAARRTSTSSSCARTRRANTPAWADLRTKACPVRWRCRRPSTPAPASNARLGTRSSSPARRPARRVTSVTKSNASLHASVLWDRVVAEVGEDYPDVELESAARRRGRRASHPRSRLDRRARRVQSSRRRALRRDGSARRQSRHGAERQPPSHRSLPVDVRAGPRLRARHRRSRHRQPRGRGAVCGNDARRARRAERRRAHQGRRRRDVRARRVHAGRRRHGVERRGQRRDRRGSRGRRRTS